MQLITVGRRHPEREDTFSGELWRILLSAVQTVNLGPTLIDFANGSI